MNSRLPCLVLYYIVVLTPLQGRTSLASLLSPPLERERVVLQRSERGRVLVEICLRETCFFFKPGFMMMKVKTRSHDEIFFFSSKFYCVNFENTIIISVIGVSLSCIILSLILFHFSY
jgi:hypothetical protein